jgi:hypothetical protein
VRIAITQAEAWALAGHFADEVATAVGPDLLGVVVVGSLALGTYLPGRSDIDTIVVVRDTCPPAVLDAIAELADRYSHQPGLRKGFGGYGVRESDLYPPFGSLRDEVYEILQLKRQGRVIRGHLDLATLAEPSPEDLRRSLAALVPDLLGAWHREYPPPLDPDDARVNTILYWLRLLLWDRTGRYVLDKREALSAAVMLSEVKSLSLGSVAPYVMRQADHAVDAAAVCREVEAFVLAHVAWARAAAATSVGQRLVP